MLLSVGCRMLEGGNDWFSMFIQDILLWSYWFWERHIPLSSSEVFIAWEDLLKFIHGRAWSQCAELCTLKLPQWDNRSSGFPSNACTCASLLFSLPINSTFFLSFYCTLEDEEQTVPTFLKGFSCLDLKYQSPFRRAKPEQSLSLLRRREKRSLVLQYAATIWEIKYIWARVEDGTISLYITYYREYCKNSGILAFLALHVASLAVRQAWQNEHWVFTSTSEGVTKNIMSECVLPLASLNIGIASAHPVLCPSEVHDEVWHKSKGLWKH